MTDHPEVKHIHVWSDGPTTQYRSKYNFFLASKLFPIYGFKTWQWNFSQAGHGKGAVEGIGGAVKRIADSAILHGSDIKDGSAFFNTVANQMSIKLHYIPESSLQLKEKMLPKSELTTVKGTLKLHQIFGGLNECCKVRDLSCYCSKPKFCQCHSPRNINLLQTAMNKTNGTSRQQRHTKSQKVKGKKNCRKKGSERQENMAVF